MNTEFGPVKVTSKRLVASNKLYSVTLEQPEYHHSYTLEDKLAGLTSKAPEECKRKVTIRVALAEADDFTEGKVVPGHIQRTVHAEPRYRNQKEAYTGGFPCATWVPNYTPDVDLRATP